MVSGSKRAMVVALAVAALLAGCSGGEGPASAVEPKLEQASAAGVVEAQAAPSCERGGLVDDSFRDAALALLTELSVHAPGQAAHGAIRAHLSPGLIDPDGQAWHYVPAYHANLAMAEALRVSPRMAGVAAAWLRWQVRHMRVSGRTRGVVFDHWVRAADQRVATCPAGGPARRCPDVDSYDATAASLLLMADAYHAATGDVALLREPAVRAALQAAAAAVAALVQPDGLTWAKPDYRVAYLMDAVEVAAGWRAWARVQGAVLGDVEGTQRSLAAAQRTEAAVRQQLWDAPSQTWSIAAQEGPAELSQWYPDAVAQAWPLLWGVQGETMSDAATAWRKAALRWGGEDGWSRRNVDPDGFWWPAVAVAAHCVGDTPAARTWVARARRAWLRPDEPFAWPFHVGDLRWLFWMSNPMARAPAG